MSARYKKICEWKITRIYLKWWWCKQNSTINPSISFPTFSSSSSNSIDWIVFILFTYLRLHFNYTHISMRFQLQAKQKNFYSTKKFICITIIFRLLLKKVLLHWIDKREMTNLKCNFFLQNQLIFFWLSYFLCKY